MSSLNPKLMDLISVYPSSLTEILKEVKGQGIRVKLQNKSGHWSEHFGTIEEIKEHRQYQMTLLILSNPVAVDATVFDVKSISAVEMQHPYFYDGKPYSKIKVINEKLV